MKSMVFYVYFVLPQVRENGLALPQVRQAVQQPQAPAATVARQQGTTVNPMGDSRLVYNPMDFVGALDVEQPSEAQQRPQPTKSKPKIEPVATCM